MTKLMLAMVALCAATMIFTPVRKGIEHVGTAIKRVASDAGGGGEKKIKEMSVGKGVGKGDRKEQEPWTPANGQR